MKKRNSQTIQGETHETEAVELKDSRVEQLKQLIKDFPITPGVYLMKNRAEKIIYVGKAKNLRSRVRSYFNAIAEQNVKTSFLVRNIQSIDYILTETEVEAFLLEASLIKKHRPRYNIRLKDDKAYPYIRLSLGDTFPRLYLSRKVINDGSSYFGPYTSGLTVRRLIQFLNKAFRLRDCSDAFMNARKRPCMTYEIGRCTAPCVGYVDTQAYLQDVQSATLFLKGQGEKAMEGLKQRMLEAADLERFELAAKLRDSVFAIEAILEKQSVVGPLTDIDQDIIGFYGDERGTLVETLHVRQGRVIGSRPHFLSLVNPSSNLEDVREWLTSFLNQYYVDNIIPHEVVLPVDLGRDLNRLLEDVLFSRAARSAKVYFGSFGEVLSLVELANKNAEAHFQQHVSKSEAKIRGLEAIKKSFKLEKLPRRIECFDISNFQGAETVASQVVFEDGVPNKDQYRRYKIKTVAQIDDFKAMKEVISRRLRHSEWELPDLIVVDGGKGQLAKALEALKELGHSELHVVGLAKARTQSDFTSAEVDATLERFFLPGRANPVTFANGSEALRILTSLRDEAHRFAITYHRKLREGTALESVLDGIAGLSEKRKLTLLKQFHSVDEIAQLNAEDIARLPGFNLSLATSILSQLKDLLADA